MTAAPRAQADRDSLEALLARVSEAVRLSDGLTVTLEARDAECVLLLAEQATSDR